MKASKRQQHLLIDLQEIDTQLIRLARQLERLPEKMALKELEDGHKEAKQAFFAREKVLEDLNTEIARLESDVAVVTERKERTSSRLAESTAAKEASALQEELDTLAKRSAVLEDRELALMEQAEEAQALANEAKSSLGEIEKRQASLLARIAEAEKDIASSKAALANERGGLSAEIQGDLRALYESTRERYGMGAAKLIGRVSGGSNMELDAADLTTVNNLPEDEIYFCPVSGVILVRDYQSE